MRPTWFRCMTLLLVPLMIALVAGAGLAVRTPVVFMASGDMWDDWALTGDSPFTNPSPYPTTRWTMVDSSTWYDKLDSSLDTYLSGFGDSQWYGYRFRLSGNADDAVQLHHITILIGAAVHGPNDVRVALYPDGETGEAYYSVFSQANGDPLYGTGPDWTWDYYYTFNNPDPGGWDNLQTTPTERVDRRQYPGIKRTCRIWISKSGPIATRARITR